MTRPPGGPTAALASTGGCYGWRAARAVLALAFAGILVTGCSLLSGGSSQESAPVLIRIENSFDSDVQITALRSGGEVWRDQVRPFEDRAFEVRGGDLTHATIQFLLERRASTASYVTTGVAIRPGDVVIIHIDEDLRRSSAMLQ